MSDKLIKEIEARMDTFFAAASDEEFWATLKAADKGGYSQMDVPLIELHEAWVAQTETVSLRLPLRATQLLQRCCKVGNVTAKSAR